MKKIASKHTKLTLSRETVRTLTSQDLSLVVGGACKNGSEKTLTKAPIAPFFGVGPKPDIPTC